MMRLPSAALTTVFGLAIAYFGFLDYGRDKLNACLGFRLGFSSPWITAAIGTVFASRSLAGLLG